MKSYYRLILVVLLCFVLAEGNSLFAQQLAVKGTVTDATDESPIPGVNILIKGTSTGAFSDFDGKFNIKVEKGQVLVFSFVGYETLEMEITNQTVLNVKLDANIQQLDEIVVVGYGSLTQREVTGSIARVKGQELAEVPTPSFEAALQGQAAGVQVIQGSGYAGSGSVIRIRGAASVSASGDPLYVVDGLPVTSDQFLTGNEGAFNTNPLASLNPNDIEDIKILKDASAVGIYGSRAANGVVFVTTKRGKSGKPKFTFSTRHGVSQPVAKAKMLNTAQYLQLRQEAWENDGGTGAVYLPGYTSATDDAATRLAAFEKASQVDTDWWDETTRVGYKQDYNLSMSQGTDKLKSYVGASYSNNESYLKGNKLERFTARANLDYALLSNLDMSLGASFARMVNHRVDAAWTGGLGDAMSEALPIYPVYNDDGSFFLPSNKKNPLWRGANKTLRTYQTTAMGNLNFTYRPVKNLTIKVGGNYEYLNLKDHKWESGELLNTTHKGTAELDQDEINNYNWVATAEYKFDLGADHTFKWLLGHEYQRSETKGFDDRKITDVTAPWYDDPEYEDTNYEGGTPFEGKLSKFISYFGRLNYTFKDRYTFQATLRADGSSKFGDNKRFGVFPTAAVAWIVSEEAFLKNSKIISFLKLKSSWGLTGNSNFGENKYLSKYVNQPAPGYNGKPILYPEQLGNPDLQWEQAENYDAGIEIGLFNDRITSEISYYRRYTSKVLMEVTLAPQIGFEDKQFDNVGEILNEGVEFSITTQNLTGAFQWSTTFNIAHNNNIIKSIGKFSQEAVSGGTNDTRVIPGYSVGTNYLVRFSRIDPENGRPIYLDKEGYETYTWDPANRVAAGNIMPDFTGSLNNTFAYKNFDMQVLFVFTRGGDIFDSSSKRQLGVVTTWNMREDLFDRWRQPGDQAQYPRLTLDTETYGSNTPWINTDQWLHDGSYMRLRRLSIGYTFSSNLLEKLKLSSARVSLTGTNLLTFTEFPGLDPEVARDFEHATDRNLSPNVTYLTPPQERTFTLGLNVSF
ncbi:TonB-dependent receptor [Rapidithrix thailandica]|uniref:TonB-dependent receptor n=1 Tax=Rapidithrix thailandica TaxID=413964 RepID=A0AAW9S7V1_9BACT